MAQFKKGQSGNPAGRKPGTKNRRTKVVEEGMQAGLDGIAKVVTDYISGAAAHSLADDLNSEELTPRDRMIIMERYAQYAYPKMQATAVDFTASPDSVASIAERLAALAADPGQ